jgi:hypothetical protein
MAAATEPTTAPVARPRPGRRDASGSARRGGSGPDRLTVLLLTIAAFLAVLALLAGQLRASSAGGPQRPVVVLRKVYETRVVTTVRGPGGGGAGTSVTQSVSSSGSAAPASAPTTRSS